MRFDDKSIPLFPYIPFRDRDIESHFSFQQTSFLDDTLAFRSFCGNQVLEPTGVFLSGISAEEPSAGTSFGIKRKRESEGPSAGTSNRRSWQSMSSVAPPRIGKRPIFPVFVQKPSGEFVRIKALMDSGATTFCFSERFCSCYMIPKVQRDLPLRVADVTG